MHNIILIRVFNLNPELSFQKMYSVTGLGPNPVKTRRLKNGSHPRLARTGMC